MLTISLTACGETSTKEGNLKQESSKKISKSSKKMSQEDGLEKLMEISEKLMNDEITSEDAKKMQKEIKANMESKEESMKRTTSNISDFDGMPSWAKSLNISEPEGVSLIAEESSIIKAKGAYSDGFTAVYEGNQETLISEAKKIGKELNLKIDFEEVNVLMISGEVDKYSVGISITDNGDGARMIYSASDLSAQKELMKKHNK